MTDDIFKIKPTKSAVLEDDEKFIIYAQSEIIQKIRMLEKGKCIITAYFDDGKQSLLTAIIGFLPAKKIVLLDLGPDESINKALLSSRSVTFKSQLNGVTAKFSAQNVKQARYQNESVFACTLPENILWVQRRDTYRVNIPMSLNAFCLVHHDDNKARQYRIHDISVGGLSLEDTDNHKEFALGNSFDKCEISLPGHGSGKIKLKVRSHLPAGKENKHGRRIGCLYLDLRSDVDAMIQRFIHSIDSQRKKLG